MFELHATIREARKKLGSLRNAGVVPAILYGPGVHPLPLAVKQGDFERAFSEAGESSLLKLVVDQNGQQQPHVVLIRGLQRDPMRGLPVHLDFHAVRLDEEIKIDVPLHFVGVPPIEARSEGVVVKDLHEVKVMALPENLPHEIDVDISSFETIDAEIRLRDIKLPDGVRIAEDLELVVVHAAPLMSEEEAAAIEAPSVEDIAAVEVVGAKEGETAPEENAENAPENKAQET